MGDDDGMGCAAYGASLNELKNAADFDKAFIAAMIPHHQMAVMMAQMVVTGGDKPALKNLAQVVVTGQSAEIAQMQAWYQQWYGAARL